MPAPDDRPFYLLAAAMLLFVGFVAALCGVAVTSKGEALAVAGIFAGLLQTFHIVASTYNDLRAHILVFVLGVESGAAVLIGYALAAGV